MGAIASLITSLTIVYSTGYSDADQRKHKSSASLAFVWRIHRGPVNSPHKWPVTRKCFHLMTLLSQLSKTIGIVVRSDLFFDVQLVTRLRHSSQWRHNGHHSVWNHQPDHCLLHHLFRCRSKKSPKLRVIGLCAGNSPVIGEFPVQMASNADFFPFDDVIMGNDRLVMTWCELCDKLLDIL